MTRICVFYVRAHACGNRARPCVYTHNVTSSCGLYIHTKLHIYVCAYIMHMRACSLIFKYNICEKKYFLAAMAMKFKPPRYLRFFLLWFAVRSILFWAKMLSLLWLTCFFHGHATGELSAPWLSLLFSAWEINQRALATNAKHSHFHPFMANAIQSMCGPMLNAIQEILLVLNAIQEISRRLNAIQKYYACPMSFKNLLPATRSGGCVSAFESPCAGVRFWVL